MGALPDIKTADEVYNALEKAREHAKELGKPVMLSRVALCLGLSSDEFARMEARFVERENKLTEEEREIWRAIKIVKQECRADLEDCIAEPGNRGGFMFLGKVNHGMHEHTVHDVNFKPVRFSSEDEIPD